LELSRTHRPLSETEKLNEMPAGRENKSKTEGKFLRFDPEQRRKMMRRARFAAMALMLIVLLVLIFGGQSGLISIYRYSRYEKILERKLTEEKNASDSLQQVLIKLRSDPEFRERAAREKLRMIDEGEMIFRFDDRKK